MEEMMAEQKVERDTRDAQKSFQATQSAATDVYKTGIDLFRRGMGRNIEVQKRVLDAASQLNAETVDLWRTTFRNFPGAGQMFNLAEQTVENVIGMRRSFLDMIEGQSDEMAESAKTQGERTARATHEITESVQRERQKTA
jgi:hypothetical protein